MKSILFTRRSLFTRCSLGVGRGAGGFCTIALLAFCFQLNAQTSGILWVGSRSATGEAKAVHTVVANANNVLASGEVEKFLGHCSSEVTLADQGSEDMIVGKTAIRERLAGLSPSNSPQYRYDNAQVRLLSSDVAVAIWGIARVSDNARSQATATLRKVNGQWKIELCVCDLAEMLG